jgi:putative transposase
MARKPYDSDVTDEQWRLLNPLLNQKHIRGWGRPRRVDLREVTNAIFYLNKTGCQWRSLPHDFPVWPVVYYYFKKWRNNGTWVKVNDTLRKPCRLLAGHESEPTAACIDSQSIKGTSESGGQESGYDGGKGVKGRKRHIAVDTMGYVLVAKVHAANEADTTQAVEVATQLFALFVTLKILFADAGYKAPFIQWVKETFGIAVEVVKRVGPGFQVVRKRWVVERTFAWISRQRRMSRDYERTTKSSAAMINISMIRIMLKQLSPVPNPWRKNEVWSPLLNYTK